MVPRVLLQGVQRCHVVGWHPAHVSGVRVRLAPFAGLVVAEDPHLLALLQAELVLAAGLEIVQRHEQLGVILLGSGGQQVLLGGPSVRRLKHGCARVVASPQRGGAAQGETHSAGVLLLLLLKFGGVRQQGGCRASGRNVR